VIVLEVAATELLVVLDASATVAISTALTPSLAIEKDVRGGPKFETGTQNQFLDTGRMMCCR
jgi:hypothetical protein